MPSIESYFANPRTRSLVYIPSIDGGTTSDTAVIQAALDAGGDVHLYPGATYKLGTALSLDPIKASLVGGPGTIIDARAIVSGDAIKIEGSARRAAMAIYNLTMLGAPGANALRLGGPSKHAYAIAIEKVAFEGFSSHWIVDDNCFLVRAVKCTHYNWYGASISYKSGVSNSGENITFEGCSWHDAATDAAQVFDLDFGFTYFEGCSFDYMPKIGKMSGVDQPYVSIRGGHIEYAFPHYGRVQAGPMIDVQAGTLLINGAAVLIGSGANSPLVKMSAGAQSIGQARLDGLMVGRLLSYDYLNNANYLVDRSDSVAAILKVRDTALSLPPPTGADERVIFPTNGKGLLPQALAKYTVTGTGTVTLQNDATYGGYFRSLVTNGAVSIQSPIIPCDWDDAFVAEYWFRLNALPGNGADSYALMRMGVYDSAGAFIAGTSPQGSQQIFTGADGVWKRRVPVFKSLSNDQNEGVAGIGFLITLYNASGTQASLDVQIPKLQKL